MGKVRRLTDLFVVGKEIEFDDGQGEPVKIWLQKISPLDHATALRKANQARAIILAKQGDDTSEWDISLGEAEEMERKDKIEFVVLDEVSKRLPVFEAEAASEGEWSEEGYLQGLKDSWDEELSDRYQQDPEDEEALHVFNEMKRYTDIVEKRLEDEKETLRRDYEAYDDERLSRLVAEKFNQAKSDVAWLNEFRRCEIWLALRDPRNHNERYLLDRTELELLSQEVLVKLLTEYRELTVDPVEGKDSPEPDSSSDSSESPEQPEPAKASGQLALVE